MICRNPNCEMENSDGLEFCKYCGRRLRAPKNSSKRPLQLIAGILVLIFLSVGVKALFASKGKMNITKQPEDIKKNEIVQTTLGGVKGYKFAFARGVSPVREIYLNNTDGTIVKLTNSNTLNAYPSISPDGTKVAFERKNGKTFEVYIVGINGKGEKKLAEGHAPTWATDGSRIWFYVKSSKNISNVLNSIMTDGADLKIESTTSDSYFMARFAPDGSKIAMSKYSVEGWGIYTVRPDLTNRKTLVNSKQKEDEPTWSPDSTKVAFTGWKDSNADIFVVDSNKNLLNLTNTPAEEYSPTWTKDGKIIYTKNEAVGPSLYIMDADGLNQKLLLKDAAYGSISIK
ncbi:MAG TPA: hypothetical protein DIC60_04690 [Lachnospiraceae bacterium]|nr:hypothetical protein [Lachnospiraceae bacterium]